MIVIIKPTRRCNARCVYCQSYGSDAGVSEMSEDTLDLALLTLTRHASQGDDRKLLWTWHGGEPLLSGPGFFKKVAALSHGYEARFNVTAKHLIQTNLTLLDPCFADVLFDLCGENGIGTSFDIFGELRPLVDGDSYEELWLRGVSVLKGKGMGFGLSYVVHKKALGQEKKLYGFLKGLDRNLFVRFNPVLLMGLGRSDEAAPYRIEPEEYGEFLIRMAEVWEQDRRRVGIQPLGEWVRS